MKKNLFLLSSIMMVSLLLTACLSRDEEAVNEPVESTEQAPTEEQSTPDEGESTESTELTEPSGTLTQSDGQNYELYVQDGYELTAEEPNKDVLYVADNTAVFMRVETFSLDEADYDFVADTMQQTLAAVNPEQEPVEVTDFNHDAATQSTVFNVPSSEGTVTGIVYELENLIVRLTIFDDSTVNATEDFIAMGKTIKAIQ
ncbi:hypothetical protein B481_2270 [Planococcus halocryophilus Or1]|uniref:Lipoprotein n=1 Tax=Planococcus halocryophilus TaxID=1215089 RepID=A0A1C7DR91_9BACL|nr:hypothetical protein [Planococcus halocryophilus]ANU13713.1 hypothetical protein BBI08_07555 [Planococcus halocryophilus]EMF46504.1 hypothetical protein B481_2270 [Planococcus halocryophilus Or1]